MLRPTSSIFITTYQSILGNLTLSSDGKSLTGLWLENQTHFPEQLLKTGEVKTDLPVFILVQSWLEQYFKGEQPELANLPLAPQGSQFRQVVWQELLHIPYGQVTTYGDLSDKVARTLGKPSMSSQAIGGAVGHNPISIIIPCHRVVGSNGSLTGYAGGLTNKVKLLTLENVEMSHLYMPK